MIYLDNSATTVPEQSVIQSFTSVSEKYFANPSSIHELGGKVEQLQMTARKQAANLIEVEQDEIVFTSGGTEGNNIAIKGIALKHSERGKHIITSEIEHPSVYDTCRSLTELGFKVTFLPVNKEGVIDIQSLKEAITDDTILVSIMHVNNEIGAIQPLAEIGKVIKKHPKIFFHVDAVQALGKVPIDLKESGIDLCTFSGHKINGLKGTGMVYVKKGIALYPLFHGGNQEYGMRSGTENVAGNVSFVRALRLTLERMKAERETLQKLSRTLIEETAKINGVHVNSTINGAPQIVHLSVPGLKPEVVIHALYEKGIVISTQSACSSKQSDNSRVLQACQLSDEVASSGLRISLSYDTTEKEIDTFISVFKETIEHLKGILE